MLAVIKTGGKQYLVSPKKKIRIEKLEKKEGAEISFSDVFLVEKNKTLEIGTPRVKGAKVTGIVLKQGKADKIVVATYKAKTRQKRKAGHRQPYTEVEIKEITLE
jgi:large subunit ribosomal protein L21